MIFLTKGLTKPSFNWKFSIKVLHINVHM
jgi:hypothetical protein